MKFVEMLIVTASYVVGVSVTYVIVLLLKRGDPTIALIVGAAAGTFVGSYLYSRREPVLAGLNVKAKFGLLLAGVCLAQSLLFQAVWHWISRPEPTIAMAVAGTFVFPIALFGTMELIFIGRGGSRRR